jgi:hypothetical protein
MLRRWQLGTPYLDVVADVVKLVQSPVLAAARPVLVIDATGVGEPVVEAVVQQLVANIIAHRPLDHRAVRRALEVQEVVCG